MKNPNPNPPAKPQNIFAPLLLLIVLAVLFWRSFLSDYVHFSNDGPLGQQTVDWLSLPSAMTGMWDDLNDVGLAAGSFTPSVTALIKFALGPVGFAKFLAPIALFILGTGAWIFFRSLKLTPLAAALGALATMLNSTAFGDACWGTASHQIAQGLGFLALALIVANDRETPWHIRWIRLALAGFCVGINVIEAADIGALYSLVIASFVFFKSMTDADGTVLTKTVRGISRVAIVAVFAGFIAVQTITSLIGTSIQGVAGAAQDTETKSQHWDWATQWSLPKKETMGLIIPGLFGYKMDTPKDMMPQLQDAYRGGVYWGGVGRDPGLDRFLDAGGQGAPPSGFMRFSGYGNYCGILVALIAAWSVAQSFRRQNSPFNAAQKKLVWFWTAVLLISLPLAWGRFAPFSGSSDSNFFYALLYKLPYFSTIRNPLKFLYFFSLAAVILFAYGIHVLNCRHLNPAAPKAFGFTAQLRFWWIKAGAFDRKWTLACAGIWGAGVLGWLIYSGQKNSLVHYLKNMGYSDEDFARQIAAFSLGQLTWWLVLFAIAIGLVTAIIAGCFNGPRAKIGSVLLGAFLVFDLGRADLPYIIHWDYKQKYDIDPANSANSTNPIINFLRDKSYEHRVAYGLPHPLETPEQFGLFSQLYSIEWAQHHFPYYNIQSLDIIQMSRMPADLAAFDGVFQIGIKQDATGRFMIAPETFPRIPRLWELTNTRYLLGPAAFLDAFNAQFDPGKNRFHIIQRFNVLPRPGIAIPDGISPEQFANYLPPDKVTAFPNADGAYALFDFTGALPRAKLYSNWQVNTNDQSVLNTLADLNFDPAKTVLISTPQAGLPAVATNENSGTVEFKPYNPKWKKNELWGKNGFCYAPKDIVLDAKADVPSVLLLNDKFDPNWRVTMDGQPAELLRCNFLMRGVYLPPGAHTVEFNFSLSHKALYITLAAFVTGIFLLGILVFLQRRKPAVQP
jgi:hypothetical protein